MQHIINTEFGRVKVSPIFDGECPTSYKCYLIAAKEIIVRVRDLHRLSSKLKLRIQDNIVRKKKADDRLYFRYR